ncbi:unnamed protein product [Rotaria socialis]|uniref:Uncharacterized protein n=1 Tax=Rotaria socialis TaxID=392032 RepID=A0A817U9B7_9BILA|nr:unnamed protein product [Rotaria socialis]CAF3366845.1 unnamed protein product [Rotaria socialis]CAF3772738.1 unnamed protein product [Rotaria socialis]CAF4445078.1 unnamed protein product [Rotaria socialis]CAF4495724.1 unnamed protein product [Rotaria socialis]
MTNKLFIICLLTGFICAYCEYYWMRHGYRSLALVASKCPKSAMATTRKQGSIQHASNHTILETIVNWFSNIFATTKDKQGVPVVCETFEIHTDPRSTFILVKTFCLIGLTLKLISSLKTVPGLIRARSVTMKESNLISSMPKGDGMIQQSKLFESSNGKIGLITTSIDKRNLSVR